MADLTIDKEAFLRRIRRLYSLWEVSFEFTVVQVPHRVRSLTLPKDGEIWAISGVTGHFAYETFRLLDTSPTTWTLRLLDISPVISVPGLFVPKTFRSQERIVVQLQ